MKLFRLWLTALVIASTTTFVVKADLKYVDATQLRIINRAWDATDYPKPFNRMPNSVKDKVNSEIWGCSYNTPGVAIRFATNSRTIAVKYTLYTNTHMNHQAPTGTKGVDLYILDGDSLWRHANTLRPQDQKTQTGTLLSDLNGAMHEYMLYLPTYDGVTKLEIGIDETAEITKGNPECIHEDHLIVAYGTSIIQGGCASRPGMIGTTIISRALNCQVANLGFSGQGTLTTGIDEALKSAKKIDAIIIDPIPNCDDEMLENNAYPFLKRIRENHPGVPVVMVEGPIYPYAHLQAYLSTYLPKKNRIWHDAYIKLLQDNPDNLYYVDCENLDGIEDDGTVDGIHLTDLGFKYYAEKLLPTLRPLVKAERLAITSPANHSTDMTLCPTFTWSDASREVTLQISTGESFSSKDIVYQKKVKGGKFTVPQYVLGACTKYYARLAYSVGDMSGTTAIVDFTTLQRVPDVPTIANPENGGTLFSNHHISINPVEGVTGLRLEVSASQSFPSRTSYIAGNISTSTWQDPNEGSEISINGKNLQEGVPYYARVRASYNTPDGSANTDFSPVVTFYYSSENLPESSTISAVADLVSLVISGNGTSTPVITLEGSGQAVVELYTLDGRLHDTLHTGSVSGSTVLPTPAPGAYLVGIAGRKAQKLIVR